MFHAHEFRMIKKMLLMIEIVDKLSCQFYCAFFKLQVFTIHNCIKQNFIKQQ